MDRIALADRLKEKGLRVTQQRVAVLEYLCATPTHPTAEEIGTAVNRAQPTTSRASVYNVLHSLKERGLIEGSSSTMPSRATTRTSGRTTTSSARPAARCTMSPSTRCRRCRRSASRPAARSRAWTSPSAAPARPARAGPDPPAGLIQPHRFRSPVRGPNWTVGRSLPSVMAEASVASPWQLFATGVPARVAGSLVRPPPTTGSQRPASSTSTRSGRSSGTGSVAGRGTSSWSGWTDPPTRASSASARSSPGNPVRRSWRACPKGRSDLVTGLLRAGVLEVFTADGLFREALERARVRASLPDRGRPEAPIRAVAEEPDQESTACFRISSTGSTSSASPRTAS